MIREKLDAVLTKNIGLSILRAVAKVLQNETLSEELVQEKWEKRDYLTIGNLLRMPGTAQ